MHTGQDCTYHASGNPCCTFVSPWIYPDPNTTNIDKLTAAGTPLKKNDTVRVFVRHCSARPQWRMLECQCDCCSLLLRPLV